MPVTGAEAYLTAIQLQDMVTQRGGVTTGMAPSNDPLSSRQIFQFNDGTAMVVTWDQDSQRWLVDDWGTTGDSIKAANKKQQANQQFEVREVGGKLLQIFGDGTVKVLMDVPQPPQAPPAGQFERAQQDYDATVKFLQQEIAAGRMTPAQASRELASIRQSVMRGSTRFEEEQLTQRKSEFNRNMQMEQLQSARSYAQNQAQTGAGLLNQRVSSGTSLANNLFEGATGLYSKLLPGSGPDSMYSFNPFELAKNYVTDLGGGPETYQAASQMLQSSLEPELQPGYWLGAEGDPGDPGVPEEEEDYPISPEFLGTQGAGVRYNQGGTGGVEPEYPPNLGGLPIWAAGSAGGY